MSIDLEKRWDELRETTNELEWERDIWRTIALSMGFLHLFWLGVIGYLLWTSRWQS